MKIDLDHFFVLYSSCVPVKGFTRSIICDLQRANFDFIPNLLCDLLADREPIPLRKLLIKHRVNLDLVECLNIVEDNYNFLLDKEYGFFTSYQAEILAFPQLELSYTNPNPITNAIVDFDRDSNHNLPNIFQQLSDLVCYAVELRFYCDMNLGELQNILVALKGTTFREVRLLVKYDSEMSDQELIDLVLSHRRIGSIVVHSAEAEKILKVAGKNIIFTEEAVKNESCCGVVSSSYFTVRTENFVEAHNFNSCLNKKISIDRKGNIKNCPSSKTSFGKVDDILLRDVLQKKYFLELWNIKKDEIEVCRDCEFRYVCTDCRMYVTNSENIYSKPLKCNYDPYTGVWN